MIPAGQTTAQYQLSVEALDPYWSLGVGPYAPTQVSPRARSLRLWSLCRSGSEAESDILMLQDEIAQAHPGERIDLRKSSRASAGWGWGSWISGYGSADFFQFTAQANRTASDSRNRSRRNRSTDRNQVAARHRDLGIERPERRSRARLNPFGIQLDNLWHDPPRCAVRSNRSVPGRALPTYRGDGRPDYFYQASLLYSDTVTPSRVSLAGGVTTLHGIGF